MRQTGLFTGWRMEELRSISVKDIISGIEERAFAKNW